MALFHNAHMQRGSKPQVQCEIAKKVLFVILQGKRMHSCYYLSQPFQYLDHR